MTPEGEVKKAIRKRLKELKDKYHLWYHCPVMNGMGKPTLDFNPIFLRGRACVIEAKAPGEQLTPRQADTALQISFAGVPTFVIDNADGNGEGWRQLRCW